MRVAIKANLRGKPLDRRGQACAASILSSRDDDSDNQRRGHGRFWGELAAPEARFGGIRDAGQRAAGRRGRTRQFPRQMEPIENTIVKQWLARELRSRLRVICATLFQKRPD